MTLAATDPDQDPLTFSAQAHSAEYYLDQSLQLTFTGDFFQNFSKTLNEKWLSAADGTWYYVTPDGDLWNWLGGSVTNRQLIASLSPSAYRQPARLYDAQPGNAPAGTSVVGNTLTVHPAANYTGIFGVEVQVSDGNLSDSTLVLVTVRENQSPVLADPGNLTMGISQDVMQLTLSASDPDGEPVEFSASAHSGEYHFDQSLGLNLRGDLSSNFSGTLHEKWLQSDDGTWYYVTPDGRFWQWLGGEATNRALVAELTAETYTTPSRLYDARPGGAPATVDVTGDTLTIDPHDGFEGVFAIDISASDGRLSDSRRILVTVEGNRPPVLADPGNQALSGGRSTLIPLAATDADNDPLIFSAEGRSFEYFLDQSLGLNITGDFPFNSSESLQQKWLEADDGTWYYLTPDGGLWQWLGGLPTNRTLVANLSPAVYQDPALLYEAPPGIAPATVTVSGSMLSIQPDAGLSSVFGVEVRVSDGSLSDTKVIQVTVEPYRVVAIDETVAGRSYDQWSRLWFQWLAGDTVAPVTSFPFDFPLTDPTGSDAGDNQFDPNVFFIGGVFGSTAERSFSVPSHKHMLVALGGSFWTHSPGDNPDLGVISIKQATDAIHELALSIDDVSVPESDLFQLRAGVGGFVATFADNNWFDVATGGLFPAGTTVGHSIDGYWALIEPLAPGQHTIHFRSAASGTYVAEGAFSAEEVAGSTNLAISYSQDVLLHVNVLPADEPALANALFGRTVLPDRAALATEAVAASAADEAARPLTRTVAGDRNDPPHSIPVVPQAALVDQVVTRLTDSGWRNESLVHPELEELFCLLEQDFCSFLLSR